MSKSYKIKVNQGPGEAKFVDIPQVRAAGKPMAVKAEPGGKYQLLDASTGYAPENIRASRSGKNLQVFFEGRNQPDLVIEDYYEVTPEGFNGLIGESESGRFYEYIPETAVGNSAVPLLADGSNQVGMALGGAEINASGAAVGALVAAAGFNPLLLAPLALLGGGGGDVARDPPDNKNAKVDITKMDEDTGVKNDDWITKDQTPEFSGTLDGFKTGLGDQVKLSLTVANQVISEGFALISADGKTWTWKATDVGDSTLAKSLNDGAYKLTATIVNSKAEPLTETGGRDVQDLTIDTKPDVPPDGTVQILSINDDTGSSKNDWLTSDTTLVFKGTVNNFLPELGNVVLLELDPVGEGPTILQYVTPVQNNGVWSWEWDAQKTPFAQGNYKLTATLVDKAGNVFTNPGAKAEKNLVIDTTGPQGDKGLSIVSMSVDSGLGSFNPLDDSRKDFKTNDNTPVFTGTLTDALPAGKQIAIQLVKDGVVVASDLAAVDSSGKGWTWVPKAPLADATYKLNAQVVDAAGNPASEVVNGVTRPIAPASKDVVIDTKGPTDIADPNSVLKISAIGISNDTAAKGSSNNDFVTSDGGNKDKSSVVNEDDKLTFNGTLSAGFTKNGGKVLVQIVGMDGKIESSAYVEPTGVNWTYEHLGALAEGQYVAKTILFDPVGNMISAKDQSFLIDIKSAIYKNIGQSTQLSENIEKLEFGEQINNNFIYQYGTYKYENMVGEYFGGNLNLRIQNGTFFGKGTFKMTFWDQAGNQTDVMNDKDWTFNNSDVVSLTAISDGAAVPKDFKGGQIVGAVGKIEISSDFDMASLYDGIDSVADQAAANQVVLSNADVTLTLSMGDILALGVTNSFSISDVVNAKHKGQIQMRIDGQTGDKLNLDGLVNGLDLKWVGGQTSTNIPLDIDLEKYNVYTNAELGIALFVDQQIDVKVF